MLTLRKMLSCPKDDTSQELKRYIWTRDHFGVCSFVGIVDVAEWWGQGENMK